MFLTRRRRSVSVSFRYPIVPSTRFRPQVEPLEDRTLLNASTSLVADIVVGAQSSNPSSFALFNPLAQPFAVINDTIFFAATTPGSGTELWKSTAGTTSMVKNIAAAAASSNPTNLINVNGTLYFTADDGTGDVELWKSNGTEAGTVRVTDINPFGSSNPHNFFNHNGTLFFAATDGASGTELWRSDGTGPGTYRVLDINVNGSSNPEGYVSLNATTILFVANDGINGNELWASNGTMGGAWLVKNINPIGDSDPFDLTFFNGFVYFGAIQNNDYELWRSDGTQAGTILFKNINPNGSSNPDRFTVVGNTLFFAADNGNNGRELWKSDGVMQADGTTPGTVMAAEINGRGSSNPMFLTELDGKLLFSADDSISRELWRSDGTQAGTVLVKKINPQGDSNPENLVVRGLDGVLFFTADHATLGRELWRSDGTTSGTWLVKDINPGAFSSDTKHLTNVGSVLYFAANDGVVGAELWRDIVLLADNDSLVTGADAGGAPLVKVFDISTGQLRGSIQVYDPSFLGGVRVAMGDVNGDSIPDIIAGSGSGIQAEVKVFNGINGSLMYSFIAYSGFTGGVYVAAGDVNGDGIADIITGKDAGSVPEVKIFNGLSGSLLSSFLAFDASFTGGVRVAAGDVNGDGKADIVVGAGAGGTPQVRVFNGLDNSLLLSFLAYESTFTGGVYVAAGDFDGDGKADILTGPGAGRSPEVRTFSGINGTPWSILLAYAPSFTGGVRVAARDVNGDGKADIITGRGPGGTPEIALFDGLTLAELDRYLAYEPTFTGGIFVG